MILRKPYAMFIKLFKPIHLVLSFLALSLIFLSTKLLTVLTTYIYSEDVADLGGFAFNNLNFIIPIILIVIYFLIYAVMYRKKKPNKFYLISIITMLAIVGINIYSNIFMSSIDTDSVITLASVKLLHDLTLINIIIESINFILYFSRGLGLDIKKFDFTSDILDIDITEEDREEIEVTVNVDVGEEKRKRNKKLRKLKYFFLEHKFFIILGISILFILIVILVLTNIFSEDNTRYEGEVHQVDSGFIKVNKSYILNTDYMGNTINDNYFVILDLSMYSYAEDYNYYNKDLKLQIGSTLFTPTLKYKNEFRDLGTVYNKNILSSDINNYILIYEIPKKYINSTMMFYCYGTNKDIYIHLNPVKEREEINVSNKLGESVTIESLDNITYTINSYDINEKYTLNYNHCINDYCIESKEYLKPSVDQNYDEVLLKLNVDYTNEGKYTIKNFYNLFKKYGHIEYTIDSKTYYQYDNLDEVTSNKVNLKNNLYIEINKDIMDADSIKIIFNIQGTPSEYVLKEAS